MKQLFLIAFFIITPAMALSEINDTTMTTPSCETYVEWTGKNIEEIDLSILGDRPYRVLKPGDMATMDYIPNRLNINTTENGIILTQECG
jgi:hypothetical protein